MPARSLAVAATQACAGWCPRGGGARPGLLRGRPEQRCAGVPPHIAGFWLGLWHGLISPITFLVSLFTSNVNIYDVHNNGDWYNFGFMLGVCTAFSGAARAGPTGAAGRARSGGRSGDRD